MLERLAHRLAGSVLIWDLLLTMMCLRAASSVRLWLAYGNPIGPEQVQLPWPIYLAVATIWIVIFMLLTPQRAIFSSALIEAIGRLIAAVALAALVFAGLLYLSFRDVSRLQFLYFVACDLVVLLAYHLCVRATTRRQRNGWRRRVLLAGGGPAAARLAEEFARRPWAGVQVVGCTSDEPIDGTAIPVLGPVEETDRIVVSEQIDEVIFTLPPHQHEQVARLSLRIRQPVMLHMAPGLLDMAFARTTVETLGGIPLISLRESALNEGQRLLKQLFDITASAILLVLLAPIMALIALQIKLESPGPIFFLQERIGEHGRRFRMIKFRSMYQDAEQQWREVAQRDAEGNLLHKSSDDPRTTRVGRKLRRASLDELPQLINVLRGEMSLVGPRPLVVAEDEQVAGWHRRRLDLTPGMTGAWQILGNRVPLEDMVSLDYLYIVNWSLWSDVEILLRTIPHVLARRNR